MIISFAQNNDKFFFNFKLFQLNVNPSKNFLRETASPDTFSRRITDSLALFSRSFSQQCKESFFNPRNYCFILRYSFRAKLYPSESMIGSYDHKGKQCQVKRQMELDADRKTIKIIQQHLKKENIASKSICMNTSMYQINRGFQRAYLSHLLTKRTLRIKHQWDLMLKMV